MSRHDWALPEGVDLGTHVLVIYGSHGDPAKII